MLTVAKWSKRLSKQIILADEKKLKIIKTDGKENSKTEKVSWTDAGRIG